MSSQGGATVVAVGAVTAFGALAYTLWRNRKAEPKDDIRSELADAHMLSHHYGFDELVWNHISARVDGNDFLVTSGTEHFEEVTPESLVVSSSANANITADVIHSAIYKHRPDVGAIVHHHTPAVAAVGVMKSGLRLLVQDGAAFYNKVAYHDWEGVSDDYEECERIAKSLGPDNHTLMLRNHGALTVGRTVAEAWVRYFYLDRICQVQVACGGHELVEPPEDVLKHASKQYEPLNGSGDSPFTHGKAEWGALRRLAARVRAKKALPVRC